MTRPYPWTPCGRAILHNSSLNCISKVTLSAVHSTWRWKELSSMCKYKRPAFPKIHVRNPYLVLQGCTHPCMTLSLRIGQVSSHYQLGKTVPTVDRRNQGDLIKFKYKYSQYEHFIFFKYIYWLHSTWTYSPPLAPSQAHDGFVLCRWGCFLLRRVGILETHLHLLLYIS